MCVGSSSIIIRTKHSVTELLSSMFMPYKFWTLLIESLFTLCVNKVVFTPPNVLIIRKAFLFCRDSQWVFNINSVSLFEN